MGRAMNSPLDQDQSTYFHEYWMKHIILYPQAPVLGMSPWLENTLPIAAEGRKFGLFLIL